MAAPVFNDANVPFGSQIVTIGGTTFVCESVNWNLGSTIAERRDEQGAPAAQVFVANFDSGTAVLQLATTATIVPTIGATFTLTRNQSGGTASTVGVAVSDVGETQSQMDIRKVNVSLRRRYNS
jgi:hypothetical protein